MTGVVGTWTMGHAVTVSLMTFSAGSIAANWAFLSIKRKKQIERNKKEL